MWRKGLHWVKTGSKWAHFTCLCTPNGPGSFFQTHVFDFHPFFTPFWLQNGPFSRHFGIFHGPKRVTTGSKWAKNTCFNLPNGLGSLFEKCVFDPFLAHLWSQNGPFSRLFGIFHGPKRVTTGSKRDKNSCWSIPSGLGTTLEEMIFFAPRTLVDPPLAPPCASRAALRLHQVTIGTGVYASRWGILRVGDHNIVGGCRWTRRPRNLVWSHVAQDTARSWFWGYLTQTTHIQAIFSYFSAISQHIAELEGKKGLFVMGQSRRTWGVGTVSLTLSI